MTARAETLRFTPLGGAGEIGMNVGLYQMQGEALMVDLGLAFADDRLPGVDIVLPDIGAALALGDALKAIVITHAHEDHLGACPYLWPKLGAPIFCSPFTAAVLRRKFRDRQAETEPEIIEKSPGEEFRIGAFECRFVAVAHSTLDAAALAIRTPDGWVVHSGDWKIDPAPTLGAETNAEAFERLGDEGVLALISDSTNALSPGASGSESEVRESLSALIASKPNRILLTTFASNVARLETAVLAGVAAGRQVCVVGRSMHRMIDAAQEVGFLEGLPRLIGERDAALLPRDKVLYLCTGSQGEPRAALTRIANGQHPRVVIEEGDTVVFSSKIIPGNERTLFRIHNFLVDAGVEVVTEEDAFVHVSGHPCRDEMAQMYKWIRPKAAVPVHGEARHLQAHAAFAKKRGVEHVAVARNGDVVAIGAEGASVVDRVEVGRRALDHDDALAADDELFRQRRRLSQHGVVSVSIVLDGPGSVLAPPSANAIGVAGAEGLGERLARAADAVSDAIEHLADEDAADDERVIEAVRVAVRQGLELPRDKRPFIDVCVTRIDQDALSALEDAMD